MKKTLLTLVTLSVLAAPLNSMGADDSFYLKGSIGIGMAIDSDVDNMPNSDGTVKMTYDTGFAGSLAAGYDFASPMRLELEILKHRNDLDLTSYSYLAGSFNEGNLKSHSFMFNGFYDVDTGSPWTPYLGVGMGWSKLDITDPGFNDADSDDVFTYQFMGGVAYDFSDKWSVDAQYRFISTSDASIDGADFNFSSNDLMLGLRYSF